VFYELGECEFGSFSSEILKLGRKMIVILLPS